MKNKRLFKVILILVCLILVGSVFCYYLLRADVKCQHLYADAEHACYTMNLFGLIPIARIQCTIHSAPSDGTKTMTITLTPIGVAKKFADKNRFEATSTFDSKNHLPLSFAITQRDKSGLRSTKTTTYDFRQEVLLWHGYAPPERNKRYEDALIHLGKKVHSPLSASYHILDNSFNRDSDNPKLDIQVKGFPYALRRLPQAVRKVGAYNNQPGKIIVVPLAIGKDMEYQEEWRRRKELRFNLYFFQPEAGSAERGFFPFKVALPFHLVTFNLVDSNSGGQ